MCLVQCFASALWLCLRRWCGASAVEHSRGTSRLVRKRPLAKPACPAVGQVSKHVAIAIHALFSRIFATCVPNGFLGKRFCARRRRQRCSSAGLAMRMPTFPRSSAMGAPSSTCSNLAPAKLLLGESLSFNRLRGCSTANSIAAYRAMQLATPQPGFLLVLSGLLIAPNPRKAALSDRNSGKQPRVKMLRPKATAQ